MAAIVRNTALKRIQGDVREMMKDPSDQYHAAPLEENMFDWHFTLRGPPDTEFEGGIYHGRILLPADYPFKPPNIMLLTPNGRFEVKKKICLSISAFHPEEWQPAWGIRLILEALISFMPTQGEGAIGALDYPPEERRRLAKLSRDYKCDVCGCAADLLPELHDAEESEESEHKPSKYASQIAQLHMHGLGSDDSKTPSSAEQQSNEQAEGSTTTTAESPSSSREDEEPPQAADAAPSPHIQDREDTLDPPTPVVLEDPTEAQAQLLDAVVSPTRVPRRPNHVDTFLYYITVALSVALCALLYKKMLKMQGLLQ